jgi:signal transduction histidine kinase
MGLGLSLCRSLVVAQGGHMWCEEASSGDTRFRIALPGDPEGAAIGVSAAVSATRAHD